MDPLNAGFLEIVELHERMWGTEQYPQRPKLSDLLSSPIVVLWIEQQSRTSADQPHRTTRLGAAEAKDRYFKLSCYATPEELNEALLSVLLASKVTAHPFRKLSRVFIKQKPVAIKGVRLVVEQ